jgi:hypothetical protein
MSLKMLTTIFNAFNTFLSAEFDGVIEQLISTHRHYLASSSH